MRILRPILFSIPLVALMLSQSGCLLAAAAVGTGATVAYVKGDTQTTLPADPREIASATERAMKELDVAVVSASSSGVDAKIVGRTARDTKLQVTVKSQTPKFSTVDVRAGVFGDESLQNALLDKIKSNLGAAPTTAPSSAVANANKSATPTTAPAASVKAE
jgi:hypothetical protein